MITIIKLGGSAITYKEERMKPRIDIIDMIARELKSYWYEKEKDESIIIVHGGGSFGHPLAKDYKLNEGLKNDESMIGASETIDAMRVLSLIVSNTLRRYGLPVFPIQSSSIVIKRNRKIVSFHKEIITAIIEKGFMPLLWGDVTIDKELGVCIVSGDEIILALSEFLDVSRVVFGTDVDGVYKDLTTGEIYKKILPSDFEKALRNIKSIASKDVTGGMKAKLEVAFSIARKGVLVRIINLTKQNNLLKALRNEDVGTLIQF